MDIQTALRAVTTGRNLTSEEMTSVMHLIMSGQATPAQIGGLLIGLRMKGETVEEIAAAAKVMRELATKVTVTGPHLVDTCGTGGDGANTFNISTASAFVVAAAGGRVAKHGNRSVSSQCGSADVLEAAGIKLELTPEQIAYCIEELGVGFLFAPCHHGAIKFTIAPRREMGIRTLFNLLGPLTNPAHIPNQVAGVFSEEWLEPFAWVLHRLDCQHVLVVHAKDGLDEISIGAETQIAELRDGTVTSYFITPEQFGIKRAPVKSLAVNSTQESLDVLRSVLANQPGPARDIVALNAGAAIYAANLTPTLERGVNKALKVLSEGKAQEKLTALITFTQGC
ncbi:anthranilate phosphoribosyltransferase [Nitrosococcus watsonii]|uniref:Anthranilate phosphoribosyltransferase n=1 Tax=Nitrosococcus watsoni (strain C-113) TaxID=105559 RepID=D8KB60_NITWC|nr:anthranilate phosphoribosyltransferase [Nitrosococcus watsonii]ADJ27594.1 anthranilate phosphoribosyltransferase [Nitrosococcus watsonii C-113]